MIVFGANGFLIDLTVGIFKDEVYGFSAVMHSLRSLSIMESGSCSHCHYVEVSNDTLKDKTS